MVWCSVDYGDVYVFHVCFYLCVVDGVCVDVCSLFCVDEGYLLLASGCCLLCGIVGGCGVL